MRVNPNGSKHETIQAPLEPNKLSPHECLPTRLGHQLWNDDRSFQVGKATPTKPSKNL